MDGTECGESVMVAGREVKIDTQCARMCKCRCRRTSLEVLRMYRLDFQILLTGLVNLVFTHPLRSPCLGENGAINTRILTKPVNAACFSSTDNIRVPW